MYPMLWFERFKSVSASCVGLVVRKAIAVVELRIG